MANTCQKKKRSGMPTTVNTNRLRKWARHLIRTGQMVDPTKTRFADKHKLRSVDIEHLARQPKMRREAQTAKHKLDRLMDRRVSARSTPKADGKPRVIRTTWENTKVFDRLRRRLHLLNTLAPV
jgi:hypothetical protein